MKPYLQLAVVSMLLIGGSNLSAVTYYVSLTGSDTNPGTQAAPWRTLQKGASTASAGDEVWVQPGLYPEVVTTRKGGTADARLVFKAAGTVTNYGFLIQHPYVTIDGFTITMNPASASTGQSGIRVLYTGSYCQILNNQIHDLNNKSYGIFFWPNGNPAAASAQSCVVSNNVLDNAGYIFITLTGANHIVERNVLRNGSSADAFRVFGARQTIRRNTVSDWMLVEGASNHPDLFQTFGPDAESYDILVEGNVFKDCACQISQMEGWGALNVRDWTFRNNVFARILASANITIPGVKFYNNTFYRCATGSPLAYGFYPEVAGVRGQAYRGVVMNNAFIECATDRPFTMGWYAPTVVSGFTGQVDFVADYNFVCSTNYTPKQAAPPYDTYHFYEPHGINGGNASFVSIAQSDFRLKPDSILVGRGNPITGFNTDIDGAPRSSTRGWSIGAYEPSSTELPAPVPGISAPTGLRVISSGQ